MVPPYAMVGGNPARLIRMPFDDATIVKLLAVRWWDWDIDKITRNIPVISAGGADWLAACIQVVSVCMINTVLLKPMVIR